MRKTALHTPLVLATLLACGHSAASAHETDARRKDGHASCRVESDYQLDTYRNAFVFTRNDGRPARMSLGGGLLYVDGREAVLSAADRERIVRFEGELRQLMPEARKVATEAVDIAFAALEEVTRGLASDPEASIASLRQSHQRIRREFERRPMAFNDRAIEGIVEPLVTEFIPTIIGGAVSMAVKAVFAGEEKAKEMERRIQRMEHEIDARVEKRAEQLEPLVERLCQRMQRMDTIDNALEYRTPDGKRIDFLREWRH